MISFLLSILREVVDFMRVNKLVYGTLIFLFLSALLNTSFLAADLRINMSDRSLQWGIWPLERSDTANTGRSPFISAPNSGKILWTYNLSNNISFSYNTNIVVDSNGNIYFSTQNGYVYSIDMNGTFRWRTNINNSIIFSGGPFIGPNNVVYVKNNFGIPPPFYTPNFYLYAISERGEILWFCNFSENGVASLTFDENGTTYAGSYDGIYVFCSNGTLKEHYTFPNHIYGLAFKDEILYACTEGKIYALEKDSKVIWSVDIDIPKTPPVVGDDGTIYCVTINHTLYAISSTGEVKWTKDGVMDMGYGYKSSIYAVLSTDDADKRILSKLSANSGEVLWKRTIDGYFVDNLVIDGNDYVYVATSNAKNYTSQIYYFSPDGKRVWRLNFNEEITTKMALNSRGTLYVGTTNGTLYAIGGEENNQDNGGGNNIIGWYYSIAIGGGIVAAVWILYYVKRGRKYEK